jgi:RNA polymerase sigma factor (sigma-70 family)
MKNWHEYRNFRNTANADGSYNYFITIDGADIEVNEEVYTAYAQGAYKMEQMECGIKRNRLKKDADSKAVRDENGYPIVLTEREISLDKLIDGDWEFPSFEPSPEDAVIKQIEIGELKNVLASLDAEERELIDALFFEELTIRKYAEITGQAKSSVGRQKKKILGKLNDLLKIT